MFFDFNYYRTLSKALQKELEDVRTSLNTQLEVTKGLLADVDSYKSMLKTLTESAVVGDNFEIDFKKLNAFSIERILYAHQNSEGADVLPIFGSENTAIGYMVDGVVKEWFFSCDMPTHQRLVREFKAYRDGG